MGRRFRERLVLPILVKPSLMLNSTRWIRCVKRATSRHLMFTRKKTAALGRAEPGLGSCQAQREFTVI